MGMCVQDVLQLLGQTADAPWGVYLRVQTQQLLEASLQLLHSAYSREMLYRPVWISMEGLQSGDNTNVCTSLPDRRASTNMSSDFCDSISTDSIPEI